MLRSSQKVLHNACGLQRIEQCLDRMRLMTTPSSKMALLTSSAATTTTATTTLDPPRRLFSSAPPPKPKESSEDSESTTPKQPFVTAHLEPGEWDLNRTDPYYRPKPSRVSKLISAEDFANRNPVAFEGDFESSFSDGMMTLNWLTQKTCRQIYQMYIDMMILSQQKHKQTSHEYVCRVIAQKFNITTMRAAAVVQLQHNEEQMRRHNPELLCEEEAKNVEDRILQNIRDAYRAEERSEPPREFIETPAGAHGLGEPDEASMHWKKTDDLFDLDQKLEDANVRDSKLARMMIDGHVYKEDVDESQVLVKADGTAKRLLKAEQTLKGNLESTTTTNGKTKTTTTIPFPETNAEGEKRPRWKYVAKVVNTRAMKKKGRRVASYTNNNMENTLVEQDGDLRVATVEEAKQTAWKPTRRKSDEYIYEGAKKAWLDKTLNGKTDVWGRMPITRASEEKKKKEQQEAETAEEDSSSSDESEEEGTPAEGEDEEETESSSSDEEENDDDDDYKK